MAAFVMPSLGADMAAGTLVEWLKQPGDAVRRGDVVAVVETDKGAIEVESFQEGLLTGYLVDLGQKVPVGTPLAVIREEGETGEAADLVPPVARPASEAGADRTGIGRPPEPPRTVSGVAVAPGIVSGMDSGGRLKISPAARRLAQTLSLDPATLAATGPQGSIVLADVLAAIEAHKGGPEVAAMRPDGGEGLTGMRAAIAAAMARSKREIPHYYLGHTADVTAAEAFVSEVNSSRPPETRLLLGALFVKAVARAARKHAGFNGHFEAGVFRPSEAVHAGMAVAIRGGGLVAPALHDADSLDLDTLMARMRDLVVRVRAGRFRASELSDPTITVSSLGERGVEALYGVIYPPQVAIVGFGTPISRPWEHEGNLAVRRIVTLTLAADHRVSDGHAGARFLAEISTLLQHPEAL
ncbi:dihydrolipoamide acetyltransferase family protein [Polymorphum gilvum]|uniref:Dihydrolipoamide acetyltransferase component of pyruvate dehydrogenase complex n=1 Tax=Polymorphum gilvum (strain LMG 25793 / CGMCC 1.9160 / SL003B-26A1) TaxID=991905 RepID=F2IYS5_POLGS|nr:dihydrolipoamide acetyltransferase family protein [Polymorphum gilvum]ADZ69522.1 Probable pyruvate dehydrogenase, E2 component, dihydrolipoamide acetyltransferase [Polymorphum gilvum SL003B-26A1]